MKIVGRILLSIGAVTPIFVPYLTDWNSGHTFSAGWSKHARFHGVAGVFTGNAMGLLALWLLWFGTPADQKVRTRVAALIPVLHWATFDLALLVPTTSPEGDVHKIPRVAGIPVNVLVQNMFVVVTALGYWLDSRTSDPQ